ncbi:hypothetical protein ACNHKD_12590 [Methylocystis sp. JAN1]|uniref:hypothetical protein n=1 Tax=Methylocystis sp. JAN1 TaxID=3397211 RepID=UPI003FA212A5
MKRGFFYATALLAVLGFFDFSEAASAATKAWVSGSGQDVAGCGGAGGTPGPCRTFQYAHDNIISPGGEIFVRDPSAYGPLVITKAITVTSQGGVAFSPSITINASAADTVTLEGITIDGLQTGGVGVQVNNAFAVNLVNCVIQNLATAGVQFAPTGPSQFGGYLKLSYSRFTKINGPAVSANLTSMGGQILLDHVSINQTHDGLVGNFNASSIGSGFSISNSAIDQIVGNGVAANSTGTGALGFITNTSMSFLGGSAVTTNGQSVFVGISRSNILGCGTGLNNVAGVINSTNDNMIACLTPTSGTIGQIQYK